MKFVIALLFIGLMTNAYGQYQTSASFNETAFVAQTQDNKVNTTNNGAEIVSNFQEGAAIIALDGKFGLINRQGFEICTPVYEAATLFNNGYAGIKKNGKWTFVNKQGQKLTAHRYEWVGAFEDGLAAIKYKGKWGLLNEQGFEVVATEFDSLKKDATGNILAMQNGKWRVVVVSVTPSNEPTAAKENNEVLLSAQM